MNNQRDVCIAVKSAFKHYMKVYFLERDLDATLKTFAETLTGFGTGADEIGLDRGEFALLYERDLTQAPNPIVVTYHALQVVPLAETVGLVNTIFDFETLILDQPVRLTGLRATAVFQYTAGEWLMAHKHISLPTTEHDGDESYPIKALEERNQLLEIMVAEKTAELTVKNEALETALGEVNTLRGLIPICASCKQIRDDTGFWHQIEVYIEDHSDAQFSHGICPNCMAKLYPDIKL